MARRIVTTSDHRRWETQLRSAVSKAYDDQRRKVQQRLSDHGVSLTAATNVPGWSNDEWAQALTKTVVPVADRIAAEVEKSLKLSLSDSATWGKRAGALEAFSDRVVSELTRAGRALGERIDAKAGDLGAVQAALERSGENLTAAGRIKNAVVALRGARSSASAKADTQTIIARLNEAAARDEAAAAAEKLRKEAIKAEAALRSSIEGGGDIFNDLSDMLANSVVEGATRETLQNSADDYPGASAVWNAVMDERTRDDHADADQQVVNLGDPFEVGGEELMYPGDPAGSDGNVINCRCWLTYEGIDQGTGEGEQEG